MLKSISLVLPSVAVLLSAAAHAQISAYHDATSATHQSRFTSLSGAGYRPISLSVHGTYASPRYSAVWAKRGGPAYVGFHDLPVANYQSYFNTWVGKGYRPEIVTAAGSGTSVRMAGLFIKSTASVSSSHGMSEKVFKDRCSWAQTNDYIPTCVSIYGTSFTPSYTAIFKKNTSQTRWNYGIDSTASNYQKRYNVYAQVGVRPAMVAHNSHGRYVSIWYDNKLTSGFIARHGMSSASYQSNVTSYAKSGYYPLWVAASGSSSSTRWDALWVKNESVAGRIFSTRGTAVSALSGFDSWMKSLMQQHQIRAAGIAVARDGQLKLARGYTWAESGYSITQPTNTFRIASMSKPLTSIAVHRAQIEKKLGVQNLAYPYLPLTSFLDSRNRSVRLIHLLSHTGGWNIDLLKFDPVFRDSDVASKLATSLPIVNSQIWSYMSRYYGLQANPGTKYKYSNYGFSNLGLILSKVYSMSYENVVKSKVMTPLGLKRPFLGRSYLSQRVSGEVLYHPRTPGAATTVRSSSGAWVPRQYGGWSQENMNANGGWVMAPADYAKVLASFDVGDSNPVLPTSAATEMWTAPFPSISTTLLRGWFKTTVKDANNKSLSAYNHNGSLPGTATVGFRRSDGLSVVVMCNADIKGSLGSKQIGQLNTIANGIKTWPKHDLFPSLGIPRLGKYEMFGSSCKMSASTPVHSGFGAPVLGQRADFRLTSATGASVAMLYMGVSKSFWGRTPLPIPLSALGAPSCSLYVPPTLAFVSPVSSRSGTAAIALPIPNSSSIAGRSLFTQYIVLDPRSNALGLALTNGLETRIGD